MRQRKISPNEALILKKNIAERGLNTVFRKHLAYFEVLKKQGLITEEEYLGSYDSTLLALGR